MLTCWPNPSSLIHHKVNVDKSRSVAKQLGVRPGQWTDHHSHRIMEGCHAVNYAPVCFLPGSLKAVDDDASPIACPIGYRQYLVYLGSKEIPHRSDASSCFSSTASFSPSTASYKLFKKLGIVFLQRHPVSHETVVPVSRKPHLCQRSWRKMSYAKAGTLIRGHQTPKCDCRTRAW